MEAADEIARFFNCLDRSLASRAAPAELTKPVAVRFCLGAGGDWLLRAAPSSTGSVTRLAAGDDATAADCTITSELGALLDVASGRVKPAAALLKGLISVRGEKAVFMQLRGAIQQAALEFKAESVAMRPASSVSVAVIGASVGADASSRFGVYHLQVGERGASWQRAARWSELRALERRMSRLRPVSLGVRVPSLPRSLDFAGSLEPSFLQKRARIIGEYLGQLLAAFPTSLAEGTGPAPLREFLEPDDEMADAASGRGGLASDPGAGVVGRDGFAVHTSPLTSGTSRSLDGAFAAEGTPWCGTSAGNVDFECGERSLKLTVRARGAADAAREFRLWVDELAHAIVPEQCAWRVTKARRRGGVVTARHGALTARRSSLGRSRSRRYRAGR